MKTGVIVAMGKELELLLPLLKDHKIENHNGHVYHTGKLGGREVVATQCGIGKVNAALGTVTLIERFNPSLVISTGVAGGTGAGAGILDIVVGDRVAYHDVWCGPGTEWGDAAGCPRFFISDAMVSELPCLFESDTIKHGLICSGDIFISDVAEVERIRSLYPDVLAVDMESAAVAQACYLNKVPFFCMRVVSDTPGADDNVSQYENFWEDAPRHTFATLQQIFAEMGDNVNKGDRR